MLPTPPTSISPRGTAAANASQIDTLKIWIDAGESDPWLERDMLLNQNLDQRGIAHNWPHSRARSQVRLLARTWDCD